MKQVKYHLSPESMDMIKISNKGIQAPTDEHNFANDDIDIFCSEENPFL